MQNYIFLDLDDTLFQTLRKCEFGPDDPALEVRAHLPDGTPNSFATRKQQWLWQWLQKDFKILPVGIAEAGAWRYSYRYELTARHFPDLLEKARPIREADARCRLVELYLRSVGAAQTRDLVKFFGWPVELVKRTVNKLFKSEKLVEAEYPHKPGVWLALTELV